MHGATHPLPATSPPLTRPSLQHVQVAVQPDHLEERLKEPFVSYASDDNFSQQGILKNWNRRTSQYPECSNVATVPCLPCVWNRDSTSLYGRWQEKDDGQDVGKHFEGRYEYRTAQLR